MCQIHTSNFSCTKLKGKTLNINLERYQTQTESRAQTVVSENTHTHTHKHGHLLGPSNLEALYSENEKTFWCMKTIFILRGEEVITWKIAAWKVKEGSVESGCSHYGWRTRNVCSWLRQMFSPFHLNIVNGSQPTEANHIILCGWPFGGNPPWKILLRSQKMGKILQLQSM